MGEAAEGGPVVILSLLCLWRREVLIRANDPEQTLCG